MTMGLMVVLGGLVGTPQAAQAQDAQELLERAETSLYPDRFEMRIRMKTERPDQRNSDMVMESLHDDGQGTRIEILEPSRSRGTRFLRKGDDLWMYNPRSNSSRAIRLSPRDSFQGSVFSNNDVGDPDYSDDYSASYNGTEEIQHQELGTVETHVITATAKHPKAAYGKIKMWIAQESFIPLEMEYYAKSGLLFKRMTLSDIRELAGRRRPALMRMESLEIENAYSTVEILELEKRESISPRLFSQRALTR
jgi:outer membrane lipoprotein-sorting protein